MSFNYTIGRILAGTQKNIESAYERFHAQGVDLTMLTEGESGYSAKRTTIAGLESVTGPGTFYRRAQRTLTFRPSVEHGWWINRTDLQEQLPTLVSVRNIWTTVRNIVLRSGSPHNYLRMVEHIVALRLGLGVDDIMIDTNSGDPPLFDRSSMDLVEAIQKAEIIDKEEPAEYVTVKEPVTIGGNRGDFITILPASRNAKKLRLDCAINFDSAIGQQRIVFDVTPKTFEIGAFARTNASKTQMLLCKTVGILLADMRNLGYTADNILIHGKKQYFNEPRLLHESKALEPVWHRATLDLLAALALVDRGRFAGTVISYCAGHALDCRLMTLLYKQNLLETFQ